MKQHKNTTKEIKEEETGIPVDKKLDWILEYKWNSEADYNKYPRSWRVKKFVEGWIRKEIGYKFYSFRGAIDSVKTKAKDRWMGIYYQGKEWRTRNIITGEIKTIDLDND